MAGEVRILLVPISEITVNPGRREAAPGDVKELADSILEVGNYITRVFPFKGLRFISVNDNFDSSRKGDILKKSKDCTKMQ